jgi:hypothetical protein
MPPAHDKHLTGVGIKESRTDISPFLEASEFACHCFMDAIMRPKSSLFRDKGQFVTHHRKQ